MKIIYLLEILLIIFLIFIVISKNNLKLIVFFSASSLVSASIYLFLDSPDLALAEVAIGSAIIPLIFIIAISKQRKFLVINNTTFDNERIEYCIYDILKEFTDIYNLKLEIQDSEYVELYGIFRSKNVDLVIEKKKDKYILKGKKTSILMNKLEDMTRGKKDIKVVKVIEGETYD
ncbi:MAG: DUF4040 domain-containing protein [Firmicutes bacterium]|nr:DUF4040 domain-containing protein [Bacillota bacterium]